MVVITIFTLEFPAVNSDEQHPTLIMLRNQESLEPVNLEMDE